MPTTATTRDLCVRVETTWLAERSSPARRVWVFAYDITIENTGFERVQLMTRHWLISNADGRVEEVRGPGVVGEQPVLGPGERFSYRSFCPLDTPVGSMRGSYGMRYVSPSAGEPFDIDIPHFLLAVPSALN